MAILTQALSTFVRCNLMSFSLLSTGHNLSPFKNEKIKILINRLLSHLPALLSECCCLLSISGTFIGLSQ